MKLAGMAELVKNSGPSLVPSPQQEAVYDWVINGTGNLRLDAVAGAGKTTTLRESCRLMSGSVAFAAYNKKIADEIAYKLTMAGVGRNVQARTFHAFGFSSWRQVSKGVKVEGHKMDDIADDMRIPDKLVSTVVKLVSLGKNHGVGILCSPTDETFWQHIADHYSIGADNEDGNESFVEDCVIWAIKALKVSTERDADEIDFDDMIFSPLFHKAPIWQNDWVLVDEAQDTNPARRLFARRMLKPGGRAIFVGDPRQAIYGFTGADADALDLIEREFQPCIRLPLTITYRCPKKVVSHAQKWVDHIEAAPTAPEGSLEFINAEDFRARYNHLDRDSAVLCRNTRPIVSLAYELIRKGIACHVEGRDIGKGLIALTKRYKIWDARENVEAIQDWADVQRQKLLDKRKEREAEALSDKVETLQVMVQQLPEGATTQDLRSAIDKLFGDTPEGARSPNVTLSTIHKAKGREWPKVYLYGRTTYQPSKYAKLPWELDQENNLIYVAVTRAMEQLVEVNLNPSALGQAPVPAI